MSIIKSEDKKINIKSSCVENFGEVLQYICSNVNRSIMLTTYLKNELTQLFGKHNTRFKGGFFYYVWILEFKGEVFHVYNANGKGTQFIIATEDEANKSTVCISFLKEMEELLKNINKKQ